MLAAWGLPGRGVGVWVRVAAGRGRAQEGHDVGLLGLLMKRQACWFGQFRDGLGKTDLDLGHVFLGPNKNKIQTT